MTARIQHQMPLPATEPKRTAGWWKAYAQRLERELMLAKAALAELRGRPQ